MRAWTTLYRLPGGRFALAVTALFALLVTADLVGLVRLPDGLALSMVPIALVLQFFARYRFRALHWLGAFLCAAGYVGVVYDRVVVGALAMLAGSALALWNPPGGRQPLA